MIHTHSKKYAIIPARGGSKRIPQKNICDFLGKPLIAHSILKAIQSRLFDAVIVSTDCPQISQIAEQYGASVPFKREASLSDDHTPTLSVIIDAIRKCDIHPQSIICCIYPTAPLLQISTLQQAFKSIKHTKGYVFCATQYDFNPMRAFLLQDSQPTMLYPQHQHTRSQDLAPVFHDAGQFYLAKAQTFLDHTPIFSQDSYAIVLPSHQVQDIDTLEDLEIAKLKYKVLFGEN
ncbi:pseudaminic acid cytidylyltransferase [Helicobacter enhydrae]|uniref:Pseudaminic acid cytidylyltransferase n=2 Tax=Helicobacter enhydrae TaxID=222136 RepID=A0A1B1U510_9HELI|nr:pseudaminic acid cytidylyltransferase [Helicobacter enhydrae]